MPYQGEEDEFEYKGARYIPLDTCIKHGYMIIASDIEEIER